MKQRNFRRTLFACCFLMLSDTPAFVLPPILFAAFRQMYGISYTLLGTLVLVNFCTQLAVDLFFTAFSHRLNVNKIFRNMPLLTAAGFVIYAIVPWLFPRFAYAGLLAGTFIFSVAAGLGEVLTSPTVAALPSDNPQRDMGILHSIYGYGAAATALLSTAFLWIFGTQYWMYLTLFWALLPIAGWIILLGAPLPDREVSQSTGSFSSKWKKRALILCALCIFLGSAAENTMTNWVSVFMENALSLPKAAGDVLGLSAYMLMLALTRTLYAKYGRNIYKMLLLGMVGAVVCYLAAGLSQSGIVSIMACMLAGICTSMLWPGTLIFMEEKCPNPGVAAYALMAAGGDLGASVAPQGLGIVADTVAVSDWAATIGEKLSLSAEQIGIKVGMLCTALFPLAGVFVLLYMKKFFAKKA